MVYCGLFHEETNYCIDIDILCFVLEICIDVDD